MTTYTEQDIHWGGGAFEQAMRLQQAIPGTVDRMTPGVAVGIIAVIRSGVPASTFEAMFEGDDWSVNLWHLLPTGQYKLCTALCQLSTPRWRYDRNGGASPD